MDKVINTYIPPILPTSHISYCVAQAMANREMSDTIAHRLNARARFFVVGSFATVCDEIHTKYDGGTFRFN